MYLNFSNHQKIPVVIISRLMYMGIPIVYYIKKLKSPSNIEIN